MLVFLITCLVIVLITLEILLVSGFHARSHRLLPLVLGLFALYDFYLIVEYLTGQSETFDILRQLLLIQALDVILYYILDIVKIKLGLVLNIILLAVLILMDIAVFTEIIRPGYFHLHLTVFVVVSVLGLLTLILIKAPKRGQISKQTKRNYMIISVALFAPSLTLILSVLELVYDMVFMPISLDVSCLVLIHLLATDRLRDVDSVLKEENFQMLEIPAFLFDVDLFFLDASKKARALFPEQISEIEKSPQTYELQKHLRKMQATDGIMYRKFGERFYRCELQEARYRGKKKGYILTFMDITEQKREAELLKDVAKQKSEFLANMSHDLRSPLHAIIGSSEIALSRNEMSSRTKMMMNHIHDAGNNLLDIVNSILDFSKLESGKIRLHPHKYNFRNLIEQQARMGFINLRGKNVSLTVEVENEFPAQLYGDELRVRQMIQNLLSNAEKFTDNGYIHCTFAVKIEKDYQVHIRYTVEDTGSGMTKEQIRNIFSDYVTYAGAQRKEGTGLGLSIVKKLSEMMGGRIEVESVPGVGSRFVLEFNQKMTEDDIVKYQRGKLMLEPPVEIRSEDEIGEILNWKNNVEPEYLYPEAKVLLADDLEVNCEIFKEFVSAWKLQLDFAGNGMEAVAKAAQTKYDLIFLDQMMPVMTGTEAADEIRKVCGDVPMILLTANITEAMRAESRKHGLCAFMQKPIDNAILKANLEQYLPEKLRVNPEEISAVPYAMDSSKGESYLRAMKSYAHELETLYDKFPGYAESDIAMFRNKAHGIKGISRQLGKENTALFAEIMEMAASLENINFIRNNLQSFMDELEYAIRDSHVEIERIESRIHSEDTPEEKEETGVKEKASDRQVKLLFEKLGEALSEYEMQDIEEALGELDKMDLTEEAHRILNQVKELYDEMEYDDALYVLKQSTI